MANSWQADDEDEFVLKEPTFKDNAESSYRPAPELPPTWKNNVGLILMTTGIFVATLVIGELVTRAVSKWLD